MLASTSQHNVMKLGIMQPYLFPYIGYFQLLGAVDRFVFYDDVNFIKQGWVNRNNILVARARHMFSVPIQNASSFARINQTHVDVRQFPLWRSKFLKTLEMSYRKAPQFEAIAALVRGVLEADVTSIGTLATASVRAVAAYLAIPTEIVLSSGGYENDSLRGPDRVLDICRREGANVYYNAIGGMELYDKAAFAAAGVDLKFVKSREVRYPQGGEEFVPWLSIIDVLMFNDRETVRGFLAEYDLV